MAIPVIAGIPWLAGVIGGLFSAVFSYLSAFLTKRFAIVAAAITVIVGITTAFFAAINALVTGLAIVAPAELSIAAGLVVPSNATACATAYITALIVRWAYQWNVKIVQFKLF